MSIFWCYDLSNLEVEHMVHVEWSTPLETLGLLETCECSEAVKTIHAAWIALGWNHKQEYWGGVMGQANANSFVLDAGKYWALTWEVSKPMETDLFAFVNAPNFYIFLDCLSGSDLVIKGSLFWDWVKTSRVVRDVYTSENALILYSTGEKFGIGNTLQKPEKITVIVGFLT